MSDRGNYRPLDPRRNPVIAWGAEAAVDEAKASAKAKAVAWALEPVMPTMGVIANVQQARDGARGAYRMAQVLGGREAPSMAQVGGDWFHGAADRMRALAQMDGDFHALGDDLIAELGERRAQAESSWATREMHHALEADAQWIASDFLPVAQEWQAFSQREAASHLTLIATDWMAFEKWEERLRQLRQLARARGFVLHSPEPQPLPRTIWEASATGAGGAAAWMGLLKIGVASAIGIAGFYGLYSALRALRNKAAGDR